MQWSDRVGRRLKLRDLHILLAVARSGSMGKAATELAISQPSISKAIADAEHAVGLRLLDRGPQGIEPTIYGRALLKCGTAVFDEFRQGVKELEFLTDPGSGELRLGCTETMAAGFVSAVSDRVSRAASARELPSIRRGQHHTRQPGASPAHDRLRDRSCLSA